MAAFKRSLNYRFSLHNVAIFCLVLLCVFAKISVAADASPSPSQSLSATPTATAESSKKSESASPSASQSASQSESKSASNSESKPVSNSDSNSASNTDSKSASTTDSKPASTTDSKSNSESASSKASASASVSNKVTITASNTISADKGTKPGLTPVIITASNTLNTGAASGLPGLGSLSAMPTLSSTGVPIPTVTVPSNSNNPFMKQSTLPEGTVFIAVGCILLGILLAVVGWNLALFIIAKNSRDIQYTPAGGFGSKEGHSKPIFSDDVKRSEKMDSSMLNGGAQAGAAKGGDGSEKVKSMYKSGLFFSPTAEVMSSAQNQHLRGSSFYANADSLTSTFNSANLGGNVGTPRSSTYMPSGYYAPTTSAGVSGNPTSSIYSTAPSVQAPGNRNTMLGTRESVRAPSAYLDDFLRQD